ncbi:hypothetical protein [Terribacillus sp. JSM ZJ617]|uniref:hypothetical protein n=1 Tax=Terribacillus sp. JSM ZJ617 TaxID=3342119 RepID=UPI0035A97080
MSIEKNLELVKVALENGADISINFHAAKSKEEALEIGKKIQDFYDEKPYEESGQYDGGEKYEWLSFEPPEEETNRIETAIFYDGD